MPQITLLQATKTPRSFRNPKYPPLCHQYQHRMLLLEPLFLRLLKNACKLLPTRADSKEHLFPVNHRILILDLVWASLIGKASGARERVLTSVVGGRDS